MEVQVIPNAQANLKAVHYDGQNITLLPIVAWRIESGSAAGSVYGAPIPALQVAPQDWLPSIYDINSKLIYCQQFGVLSVREWLSRNAIPPSAWGSGFLT